MSVALYARVSSSRQEHEETIESQLAALNEFVRQKGYELEPCHIYIDDGVSGARLDRPALDRLRDRAREGAFDRVVIHDPDRLARNYVQQYLLMEEFKKLGCEVEFIQRPISDKPEDQLLLQIQGAVSEYERTKIVDRSRRGRMYWARQGLFLNWSQPPFGYRYQRYPGRRGGEAQIHEPEAHWIRQMFQWVVQEDLTIRGVARRMTDVGPPPRKSIRWKISTIRGILANPAYYGTAYYNKSEAVEPKNMPAPGKYVGRVKASERERPKDEWIPISVPAIIDEQTFLAVREQLRKHQMFSSRRTNPGKYLLRRLVRCGLCGYKMYGAQIRQTTYYRCNGEDPLRLGVTKCRARMIRGEDLDEAVWAELDRLLKDPETVREQFRLQQENFGPVERDWNARIERVDAQMGNQKRRLARLLDGFEEGLVDKDELAVRRRRIEERVRTFELQKQDLQKQKEQAVQESKMVERLDDFSRLHQAGVEDASFEERQRVVRLLVEEVAVKDEEVIIKHILPVPISTSL